MISSPELSLDIEPAVPRLVTAVASLCGLKQGGVNLRTDPWYVNSLLDAEVLVGLLVDQTRRLPIFVFTIQENFSSLPDFFLEPTPIARATLGLADVVVLHPEYTLVLTEKFGKRLSVFGGAIRVYLPGFREDANPFSGHELFLLEALRSNDNLPSVSKRLRWIAASESLKQFRLGEDVLSFSMVRQGSIDLAREELLVQGATDAEQLQTAYRQIEALKDDLKRSSEEQKWLVDEHKAIEDRAVVAELQCRAAGFRIEKLLEQISSKGEIPDNNIKPPENWEEISDWCDKNLIGRLILSPRARRGLKNPYFNDVKLVARCLLWLANDYRSIRLNGGDRDLRISFEEGVLNDRCGADSFRFEWQGDLHDVEWHIKSGGNTRDPHRCLRIYYFWEPISQHVVIASMPAHISTGAT